MLDIEEIVKRIEKRRSNVISLLQEMVRTPSITGQEKAMGDLVEREMRESGFRDVRIDELGNVIGEMGNGNGPKLLFNGHMDTVPVGDRSLWEVDPHSGELKDGRVWGRGASDMKGALAAMIAAAEALHTVNTKLNGSLIVTGVVLEENAALEGTRYTIEKDEIKPDYALVGEATSLNISLGSRGRMELEVTTRGRTAHASMPSKGVNAILGMVELIRLIEEMKLPRHEFLGDTTQAITNMTCSPGKANVIPDLCTLTIDRRTVPGEIPENVRKDFGDLFRRSSMPEMKTDMRVTKNAPPAYVSPDNIIVKTASEAVASVIGKNPELTKYKFGTDASYLSTIARIPTVGFGPGDETMAHSPNENIPIDEVIVAAKVYAILAARLLE